MEIEILFNLAGLSTTYLQRGLYPALSIINLHPKPNIGPTPMDPRSAADNTHGRLLMKVGTLACFLLAGGLLVASLFVPPPAQVGADGASAQGSTAAIR